MYQPFTCGFVRRYGQQKIDVSGLYLPDLCKARPSQTLQTSQGRPQGQSIPAQPVPGEFGQGYGLKPIDPHIHRLRCLRTKYVSPGTVTVKTKCRDMPVKYQANPRSVLLEPITHTQM